MGDPTNNVSLLSGQRYFPDDVKFDLLPAEEEHYTLQQGLSLKLGDTNIRATLFADHADSGSNIFMMGMPMAQEGISLDFLAGKDLGIHFGPIVSFNHYAIPDETGGHIETAPMIGFYISGKMDQNPVCALTGLLCD